MKPIIISVTEEKDGYIRLKKEDFERYIQDAYESGIKDSHSYSISSGLWGSNPVCREKTTRKPIEITCIGV